MNKRNLVGLLVVTFDIAGTLVPFQGCDKQAAVKKNTSFKTEYQAVLLNNGQYFFGKLENAGTAYPVMRNII